jgi:hypothetical protein
MNYLRDFSTRETPQSEPLPGQTPNSAGGHAGQVDDWARLRRFLSSAARAAATTPRSAR